MFIPFKQIKGYKIPIIFEFGQQNTRVGYAGMDAPDASLPSDVLVDGEGQIKYLENHQTKQPVGFEVKSFMQNGNVCDFDMWKEYVDHIFTDVLRTDKSCPFFFIENTSMKKETRNKLIELLFEDLDVSSVFFHRNVLLTQYLVARETLLVIDSGAYHTTVTPIVDGTVIEKAIIRGDVAGEYLNQQLYELWKPQQLKYSRYTNYDELHPSLQQYGDMEIIRDARHQICKLYDQPIQNLKFNPAVDNQVYELPDSSKLEISSEMYRYPELMFEQTESFDGLDRAIEASLEKIDPDFRKDLIQNIILVGGTTCTVNIADRLQRTLNSLKLFGLSSRAKIQNYVKNFENQHATWVGASIVASSPVYEQWTLTKQDYNEHGCQLIEKKMFY